MRKRDKARRHYRQDHTIGKIIVSIVQIGLTVVIGGILMKQAFVYVLPVLIVKELLYVVGIDLASYITETVRHHKHKHTVL